MIYCSPLSHTFNVLHVETGGTTGAETAVYANALADQWASGPGEALVPNWTMTFQVVACVNKITFILPGCLVKFFLPLALTAQ